MISPTPEQINNWLTEDIASGDVTTDALVDHTQRATAIIVAKQQGVVFGTEWMGDFLSCLGEKEFNTKVLATSGTVVSPGQEVARYTSALGPLLQAERSYLNIVQHLSGVATLTSDYVQAVSHTNAHICDTRKTTPGLRLLEKAAVAAGGGTNHRHGLYDMFLIKENHLAPLRSLEDPFGEAIRRARRSRPDLPLCIEVENCHELKLSLTEKPEIVLLDNMNNEDLLRSVAMASELSPTTQLEASGGITMQRLVEVAETGVHRISVGALTHSAKNMDISMLVTTT